MRIGVLMWWTKKRETTDAASGEPSNAPTAETSAPDPHRNAYLLIGIGGGVLAVFGLAAIAGIFAPVFLAFVLTICVHPLRLTLEKRGVPRGLATGSVIAVVTLTLIALGYAVLVAISQFGVLLTEFTDEIEAAGQAFAEWLTTIGISSEEISAMFADFDPSAVLEFLGGFFGGLASWISVLVIIFTMLLLMAVDAAFLPHLRTQLTPVRPLLVPAFVNYGDNVRRYMVVTTMLGLIQALIDWIALVLLGVPGAFIWALLAFVCSFIPNVGYFIAIIPPLVFGGLEGGWPTMIAVVIVYGVINAVIQSALQPRMVGKAVSLSQTITFFSVLFWAVVIGPIGAVLAIPLTLLVRLMLVDSNPSMNWIRPVLGEVVATKKIMAESDAAAKAAREERKTGATGAGAPERPPEPVPVGASNVERKK